MPHQVFLPYDPMTVVRVSDEKETIFFNSIIDFRNACSQVQASF
jgi:hypothetical protein